MTRKKAVLLGLATFWPVIYMFLYLGFVFGFIFYSHQLEKKCNSLKYHASVYPIGFSAHFYHCDGL